MVNSDSDNEINVVHKTTRKRKRYGRLTEVNKKLNLQSHVAGECCACRLKCFEVISEECRQNILKEFNLLESVDLQNSYLCGLISVLPIQRRRPRKPENEARFNEAVYKFRVRNMVDGIAAEVVVCRKAFISMHGITKGKIEYLVKTLKHGSVPKDGRGQHKNRPWRLNDDQLEAIKSHIKSFPGRNSHYSLHESSKVYLSEELNIRKMHRMFCEEKNSSISYESYRTVFNRDFNISFGYLRTDTCSICDEYLAKLRCLEKEKRGKSSPDESSDIDKQIKRLTIENKVHKLKADTFYARKRAVKKTCKTSTTKEAICLDFSKNLPIPNIPTNDVYYKRQLSMFIFNIHVLSTADSYFYMYPESVAHKGSNEVCSMLHHFVYNCLSSDVTELMIFCDSCGGQNKNFTFFRFLHHLVHEENRFKSIQVTFPIRGHSYLECDKNMGLINQKIRAELPKDWIQVFKDARIKPSPFVVIDCDQNMFRNWSMHLNLFYKKCPFPSRPIREYKVTYDHARLISFRTSFNGAWETGEIIGKSKNYRAGLAEMEFRLPDYAYQGKLFFHNVFHRIVDVKLFLADLIPINGKKFQNLQELKKFCGAEAQEYFSNLKHE